MGYRFNTRWSVGLGASYRVPESVPTYQGRVFVESVVYRGFLLHGAYERSLRSVPTATVGEAAMVGNHHALVGLGKSYTITQKIRGHYPAALPGG